MALEQLVVTPGEPAGIGPELACRVAALDPALVVVADPELLRETVDRLGLAASVQELDAIEAGATGGIRCLPVKLEQTAVPGRTDPANAEYVLECLRVAASHCLAGRVHGLVTGPVHKGVINDAGVPFSGHTEFLAAEAGVERVVMMLVAGQVRVALATTHLPLREVPDAIASDDLAQTLEILHAGLQRQFGLAKPHIAVLGLNPHAGEGGHLGREEIEIIGPVIEKLRRRMSLTGPLPADTAFVPDRLREFDAVLAMYHDQGLPVLKHVGFGHAVNVTLGLPFIRTSVDHGTALDLAGTGQAESGSLNAAINLARGLQRPRG
ncbi:MULTISPECIES: 4-hydroxythreonine-4-phosphate dehydrogenase PdxA [unclassified Wenzhouxiangella]|uniref:4-hydroxythreonine-4-phosphate dehydrogenase PdxA n=1 Tax=unclassified Wenzhouxiangella TaxID=2613841 RepID=UPI000E328E7C|nr:MULTISPECIES: 4-hydroxythreonine-4-phosphate dehydrogenase PdxA [unclassified Wenzhouxiangella]RFF27228.1 4-hydroxythreonine-4-phosphate dehydrogenase PdxA [Wenzhouxiangella sp. 15181]RFP69716.1 4-hydroxythreonine-4-phosphate dehydrogenase PdxA [Wenzhouxiangella sp. 15190]